MTTTRKPTIGSISSGTLRTEDLLQAFADELERICDTAEDKELVNVALVAVQGTFQNLGAADILIDLEDRLNDYAPPFCYFGTLPGDAADFGFWPDRDAIEELIRESKMSKGTGPLDQSVEYINVEQGLHILVNDHGNITISRLEPGETLLAIV